MNWLQCENVLKNHWKPKTCTLKYSTDQSCTVIYGNMPLSYWTFNMAGRQLCAFLSSQEFHLEYDKLEERPHVPTTFNYNPAQQAFWSCVHQHPWALGAIGQRQPADLPDHKKPGFIPQLSGQGLREGEGGWRGFLHLKNWGGGTLPYKLCAARTHTKKKTLLYIFILFLNSPLTFFFFFSSSPSISFRAGSMFCLLLWWKAPFGVCLESLKLQYSTQTHPLVLKRKKKTQFALCFPKRAALPNRTDTKTNPIHVNTQGQKKMQCSLLHYLVIKEHKNCFLAFFFNVGKSLRSRRCLEGLAALSLT